MLKIKHAFQKLMTLLSHINPKIALPIGFEKYLWEHMEEFSPKAKQVLVKQGEIPKYAYYIIRGYIYVYYDDEEGKRHVKRFYRENRIVAFLSFLEQHASPYTIVAGRDTLLSRVSNTDMREIYQRWEGMKEFAMLVVLQYDEAKSAIKEKLLAMKPQARVKAFYQCYPCLLPAANIRLDALIASYLRMNERSLRRCRKKL